MGLSIPSRVIASLFVAAVASLAGLPADAETNGPDYHLVGWTNAFLPGGGQALLGNWDRAAVQAILEMGTFVPGYALSKRTPLTLDGVPEQLPGYRASGQYGFQSFNQALYADLLQEFGIKYHLVNVFEAYRSAAMRAGDSSEGWIDPTPVRDLFLEPFRAENLEDPWVWIPLGAIAAWIAYDYSSSQSTVTPAQPLTPYSNALYAFNYAVWQPFGSGAPEEMFYRGFLQNEVYSWTKTPWIAIPVTAVAFAFSHAPGQGRISAAVAGSYLGFLAYRNHGRLGRGITVHFWSVVMLGIETILLNHDAQHSTPPGALSVQVNF